MRYILTSWDCEGFECLQDITAHHPDQWEKAQLMEVLRGNKIRNNPLAQQIEMMKLRARVNSHRTYEIYIITTEGDIDINDVKDWSERDPQGLADWIRINHYAKVFSDYRPKHRKQIA